MYRFRTCLRQCVRSVSALWLQSTHLQSRLRLMMIVTWQKKLDGDQSFSLFQAPRGNLWAASADLLMCSHVQSARWTNSVSYSPSWEPLTWLMRGPVCLRCPRMQQHCPRMQQHCPSSCSWFLCTNTEGSKVAHIMGSCNGTLTLTQILLLWMRPCGAKMLDWQNLLP